MGEGENNVMEETSANQTQANNLAEALKMVHERERETTQANVGTDSAGEQLEGMGSENQAEAQVSQQQYAGTQGTVQQVSDQQLDTSDSGSVGGSTAFVPLPSDTNERQVSAEDINGAKKNVHDRVLNEAVAQANKKFQDAGVKKFSIGDLYNKDENSGRVSFTNPDDPNHPFATRADAQLWIDSMNSQIDAQFKQVVLEERAELLKSLEPTLKLIDFLPTYNRMSKSLQGAFDRLIEPFAVEIDGRVIGYNCDLNAMARQAESMDVYYGDAYKQQAAAQQSVQNSQPQQPASSPALDIKAGSSQTQDNEQIKDLNDAFRKLHREKRNK